MDTPEPGARRAPGTPRRTLPRTPPISGTDMTGRPGYRTMEMIGGSSAPYLARTPCVPLFCTSFNRVGNKERFRLPGAGGGSFPLYGGTFARSYSVSTIFGGTLGDTPGTLRARKARETPVAGRRDRNLRGFQRFFRGPLRDPLRGRFPSQTLSVLLPLIVCPLNFFQAYVYWGVGGFWGGFPALIVVGMVYFVTQSRSPLETSCE